ncbi:MAG: hypothetical protein Q9162_007297 [Coniocarpon cinnabarinum]
MQLGKLRLALITYFAATTLAQTYVGPEHGHLVIVGGGNLSDSIYQRVIDFAGGPNEPLVVIPTADGAPSYDQDAAGAATFRRLGSSNVTVLNTYDAAEANTTEFIRPLVEAKGVWFGGGRQWRLVDAYAGTLTEQAFNDVLARGGVIGGSSAGATIQGSFLTRGDTSSNQIVVGDHQVGFGFIKNTAIDQHVLVRNRIWDLFQVQHIFPNILGVGIDENTAFIVNKNDAQVFGASYVAVYDKGFWSREGSTGKEPPQDRFYFLRSGDRYDLGNRTVLTPEEDLD